MSSRRAALLLACFASLFGGAGCAVGDGEPTPADIEEPLQLSVDSVTLRRGGVRIAATMADGSADVSVWPGASCRQRELGRGFATPDELAWTLSSDEIAVGIECGLVVRARTRDEDGRKVVRVATVPVSISMESQDWGPRVAEIDTHGVESKLTFLTFTPADRIHVGNVVVGAAPRDPALDRSRAYVRQRRVTRRLHRSEFEVANADLARALVLQRPVAVGGASFDVSIAIGGTGLDLELPDDA